MDMLELSARGIRGARALRPARVGSLHRHGYRIIDSQTGQQVGTTYTYANRNRARSRADRLNLEYGAHRYSARPIFGEAA